MIKIFVGGFPLNITELELVMLFGPHGDVSTIKIVRDKKTGNCKGYAFLEMANKDDADRAVEALDGTYIGDRLLNVKITEEKQAPAPRSNPKFGGNFTSKAHYTKVERTGGAPLKAKRPRKQF